MADDDIVRDIPAVNEHARAIGYVCILWAAMEGRLDQLLAALIPIPIQSGNVNHIVAANIDFREKLAMIKALAMERKGDSPWSRDIVDLMNKIGGTLRLKRNRLIHDSWHYSAEAIVRRTRRTGIKKAPSSGKRELVIFTDAPMPAKEIWQFAGAVRSAELAMAILRFQCASPE
jgi:hypothetical protein